MIWFILLLWAAVLATDKYIYQNVICARFRHLPMRIVYVIFAILTDAGALGVPLLRGFGSGDPASGMHLMMWCIWIFFLAAIPKLLFAVGAFLDYLVRKMSGRRIGFFRIVSLLVGLAVVVLMVVGATSGRSRIRVSRVELISDRLPEAFDGMRIAQFSDLHAGGLIRPEQQIRALVDTIASLKPDLVAQTGDMVTLRAEELSGEMQSMLSEMAAPMGVYAVFGNHDLGFYLADTVKFPPEREIALLRSKLEAMGWHLLEDESVLLVKDGDTLLLTGLNFPRDYRYHWADGETPGVDIDKAYAGCPDFFNIVLSHTPKLWPTIRSQGWGDLTLSGHVHSMQMKFDVFGKLWSPAEWLYDHWSGLYEEDGRWLYVNDGIGCVMYPMRIGARPEVTLIELKRCE